MFNEKSSDDMGVVVEEENFLSTAPIRYEEIQLEGKNGSLFNQLGKNNYSSSMKIVILNGDNLDKVKGWLYGEGEFIFNHRTTHMYFYDIGEVQRIGHAYALTLNYIRYPVWFPAYDQFKPIDKTVYNYGNTTSYPIVKLCGKPHSRVELTIANVRFAYNFDADPEVIIDCLEKSESCKGTSKSKQIEIGFEYPRLQIGENKVIIHSGEVKIFIKRGDFWL